MARAYYQLYIQLQKSTRPTMIFLGKSWKISQNRILDASKHHSPIKQAESEQIYTAFTGPLDFWVMAQLCQI
jgi:hypothetical protein